MKPFSDFVSEAAETRHSVANISPKSNVVRYIKQNCSDVLELYKSSSFHNIFLRGLRKIDAPYISGNFPKNRQPMSSNQKFQYLIDAALVSAGATALRSNSIFTTTDFSTADDYGKIYIIFPPNGSSFTYFGNAMYDDLYNQSANLFRYTNILPLPKLTQDYKEALREDGFDVGVLNSMIVGVSSRIFEFGFDTTEDVIRLISSNPVNSWLDSVLNDWNLSPELEKSIRIKNLYLMRKNPYHLIWTDALSKLTVEDQSRILKETPVQNKAAWLKIFALVEILKYLNNPALARVVENGGKPTDYAKWFNLDSIVKELNPKTESTSTLKDAVLQPTEVIFHHKTKKFVGILDHFSKKELMELFA